jgi:hypothetical protein
MRNNHAHNFNSNLWVTPFPVFRYAGAASCGRNERLKSKRGPKRTPLGL